VKHHLEDFVKISNTVGEDSSLVQGGGGNTSVKFDENLMYVKASGVPLKDVSDEKGYRIVDLGKCRDVLFDDELAKLTAAEREAEIASRLRECCTDRLHGRPSVETNLHALLGRCVAHTHPVALNALLCSEDSEKILSELYGDFNPPCLSLGYVDFGYQLAIEMREAIDEYLEKHACLPAVTFLGNHGLFVSGDNADEVLSVTEDLIKRAKNFLSEKAGSAGARKIPEVDSAMRDELISSAAAELRNVYSEKLNMQVLVAYEMGDEVEAFMRSENPKRLAETPALMPDQQLYCNGAPVWVDLNIDPDALRNNLRCAVEAVEDGANTPLCVLIDGVGMFTAATSAKLLDSAGTTMRAALSVLTGADSCSRPKPLPEKSLRHIKESEWGKYRHSLLEKSSGAYFLEKK